MLYDKKDDMCALELIHCYDNNAFLKITSQIITDGKIKLIDNDYYLKEKNVLPKLKKDSPLQKTLNKISMTKTKKILVEDYNYICIIYYVLLNDKWCVFYQKNMVNKKFNVFDEIKFNYYQKKVLLINMF